MGNIVFEPIVNGKQVGAVEFSQVLHVPDLRSNLLSCLYLTHHKGITINISSYSMVFRQRRKTLFTIPSFPLTTTMVKSNIQNKSFATNARLLAPQATPTSVGESPDSLNLISCASSRAGKCVHSRGCSRARCTIRRFSRSVSAAKDSRKASPEPFSSFEEEESEEKEVSPGFRTPTASRIITGKLFHRIAPL